MAGKEDMESGEMSRHSSWRWFHSETKRRAEQVLRGQELPAELLQQFGGGGKACRKRRLCFCLEGYVNMLAADIWKASQLAAAA